MKKLLMILVGVAILAAPTTARAQEDAADYKVRLVQALTLSVDYTMVSDYIWRGLNFSEFDGEGSEGLNQQLNLGFEIDPSAVGGPECGVFGGAVWFEWYAHQEQLTPWSSSNLQEVDYTIYWAYEIEDISLGIELGWIGYHFPRVRENGSPNSSDGAYTHEVYVALSWDDAMIFGESILNPTFALYWDIDDVQAQFMTLGISHDFVLADMGCEDVVVLKDTTVTPSMTLGIDHRYYDKSGNSTGTSVGTRLGNLLYGVDVAVDLSSALDIPSELGAITLTGFLYYSQSFHDENAAVQDEFFGGMNVGWVW